MDRSCWRFQKTNEGLHGEKTQASGDDNGKKAAEHPLAQFLQVIEQGHLHVIGEIAV